LPVITTKLEGLNKITEIIIDPAVQVDQALGQGLLASAGELVL
jgi:hypothetical protein